MKIKHIVLFLSIAIIFALIPIIILFNRVGELSNPGDLGAIGDYLSGTSGLILTFFAVIFSLVSLYVSTNIHIAHSKPYAYVDLSKLPDYTGITIQNSGLGPMIVSDIIITDGNNIFRNFWSLLNHHFVEINPSNLGNANINIIINTASDHLIGPNNIKSILSIKPINEVSQDYTELQASIWHTIGNYRIEFKITDVYGNDKQIRKDLLFFNN